LKDEALIYWTSEMERYFEFEKLKDPIEVKFAITRLRGQAIVWLDFVQSERV
jgi:hypothetical protein